MRPLGRIGASVIEPDLPPVRVVDLPGRGRVTARVVDGPAPVLLLHGWTLTADVNFCHLMPRLPGGLVAMDHRGHGRGLRRPERFTIEDSADDHVALLDALGIDKVIVFGYSLGGPIGLDLAVGTQPGRRAGAPVHRAVFDSIVDKLTKPLLKAVRPLAALGMGRTAPFAFSATRVTGAPRPSCCGRGCAGSSCSAIHGRSSTSCSPSTTSTSARTWRRSPTCRPPSW